MRQINFLIIFAMGLALVLFSLQNTQAVPIQVVQGVQVQAPLCIELIFAMGLGAILAWVFSVWARFQRMLVTRSEQRQKRQQEERIQELEQEVARCKAELELQNQPANSELLPQATIDAEVLTQSK
ncbi:MAG: LapA family protein [Crinalium sp.]